MAAQQGLPLSELISAWGIHDSLSGQQSQQILPQQHDLTLNHEVTTSAGLQALLSKVAGLPETLTKATESLVKESARSQAQMREFLERFEHDRALELDNHSNHLEKHIEHMVSHKEAFDDHMATHKQAFEDLKTSLDNFHEAWSSKWITAEKQAMQVVEVKHPRWQVGEYQAEDTSEKSNSKSRMTTALPSKFREELDQEREAAQKPQHKANLRKSIDNFRQKSSDTLTLTVGPVMATTLKNTLTPGSRRFNIQQPDSKLARMVDGDVFNAVCSIPILANTVILGVQTNFEIQNSMQQLPDSEPAWFRPVNVTLTILFLLELIIRLVAERLYFFAGKQWTWNIFDICMVVAALVEEIFQNVGGNYSFFRVIKIIKMGRALRIFRVFRFFRELRQMLSSTFASLLSLMWAFVLVVIMIYCSSVLLCQGIVDFVKNEDVVDVDDKQQLTEFYGSLGKAMSTHIVSISGGKDWYDLVTPLVQVGWLYVIMFVIYVLFVIFGMMNVLTGVFVDRATEAARLDRDIVVDYEKRKVQEFGIEMKKIFDEVDEDGSGHISWPQFKAYCKREDVIAYLGSMQLNVSETKELFHMLDPYRTGSVNIEDFVYGCMRVKGQAKSLDLLHIQEDVTKVKKLLILIGDQINALGDFLSSDMSPERIFEMEM